MILKPSLENSAAEEERTAIYTSKGRTQLDVHVNSWHHTYKQQLVYFDIMNQ